MKPQTYMNLSGDAVGEAARFYKIPAEKVIVVSDETALPIGRLRVRRSGSAGGHNGLKSIISVLGTENFPRIRLGVGAPPPEYDVKDWVLSTFRNQDAEDFHDAAERAAQAVEAYITLGPEKAMNLYN
jgi:PTH1 family peptidyl-tRNA hydrolase